MTWLAIVVGLLAAARLTRVVTDDDWPPAAWARRTAIRRLPAGWGDGVVCPYCVGFWTTALVGAPVAVWGLTWWWWVLAGWLAAAYPVAWIVRLDVR